MNAKPDKAPSGESGYGSAEYAWSLAHLGDPIWLPNAEGWLLRRRIPGTELWDAIGCYPLFTCRDWECLQFDLSQLTDLVSVTAVCSDRERFGTVIGDVDALARGIRVVDDLMIGDAPTVLRIDPA